MNSKPQHSAPTPKPLHEIPTCTSPGAALSVAIPFDDPRHAQTLIAHLIARMQEQGISDDAIRRLLALLETALAHSPDPDRALSAFTRWISANNEIAGILPLLEQQGVLNRFCTVTACSQYFADMIVRHPHYFDFILHPLILHPARIDAHESVAHRFHEISQQMQEIDPSSATLEQKRDLLRRWKAREMLGIGVRDLLGIDDMPTAAREFSHLADACVQMAVELAKSEIVPADKETFPIAVFGLGKLGGEELNYSSDIDLIFVHSDDLPTQTRLADGKVWETPRYLARLAERIIANLAEETSAGHLFRVDMRLRPEGRFGPLIRSLTGYRNYYERWAENWELQSLLKARFIAGNRQLGETFMEMVTHYVYRRQTSHAFLNDVRLNKRRIEQTCIRKGEEQTNIKTGYGGIRDIEFIVQLLQLEFGYSQRRLRTPNTLTALARLNESNFLTDRETEELADNYRWLRTLEHRLQLLHGHQTQTMPAPDQRKERTLLARRMGYRTREEFEADQHRRRQSVRAHLDRLFYDQDRHFFPALPEEIDPLWSDIVALLDAWDQPNSRQSAEVELGERLAHAGFRDVTNALRLLQLLRHANEFRDTPSPLSAPFRDLVPHLLDLIAQSPDPDAALSGIEMLAVPYRDPLYGLFLGRPDFMWRIIRLASIPALIRQLARHQEWIYPLLSASDILPEAVRELEADSVQTATSSHPGGEKSTSETKSSEKENRDRNALKVRDHGGAAYTSSPTERYVAELTARIRTLQDRQAQLKVIALFYQRERLRIAASDTWDEADTLDVATQLTRLVEAMLEILLRFCVEHRIASHPHPSFARRALSQIAILGMGRLGGAEMSYSSDWDILFVYDLDRKHRRSANSSENSSEYGYEESYKEECYKEEQGERHTLVTKVVQDFLATVDALKLYGAEIEVDLRLRPWGRKGGLIYSTRGYLDYFKAHADTWERQAVLKARHLAGNTRVGGRLERILRAISFGRGITQEEESAIRAMKRRIEQERLNSLERATDLKLGYGGLSDIEWLVQRLQLIHGPTVPGVHIHHTLRALDALEAIGALSHSEVTVLVSAYRLLTHTRNAMTLLAGAPQNIYPADPRRRRVLARLLGYRDTLLLHAEEILQEDLQADMSEVRRIFEHRFYNTN